MFIAMHQGLTYTEIVSSTSPLMWFKPASTRAFFFSPARPANRRHLPPQIPACLPRRALA
jgi:hypothetical protein